MPPRTTYRILSAALAVIVLSLPTWALDRQDVLRPADQEHVLVIQATVASPAAPLFAVLRDWSRRPRLQTAPTFDHWQFPTDSATGIGAWAEYDLTLGDQVVHQRMVIADEQSGRYLRERSDLPQLPCDIHWLLEPIGDGQRTAVTIAIHLPQNRNWFASLWRGWTMEPALRAAYAYLPAKLAVEARQPR